MGKTDTNALAKKLIKSMGGPIASKPRKLGSNLGFENERLATIFRAVAHAYPKAVSVREKEWKAPADEHVRMGYMSCAIHSHGPTYRLTASGVQRAKDGRLI